ncbi:MULTISPECIES: hypothetical protein, partial [unclassified Legionella]|uniref:hypothetical protein n=1 Tax=unclassified Legionella TaxID=2622702 RepID=UPI003AF9DB6F
HVAAHGGEYVDLKDYCGLLPYVGWVVTQPTSVRSQELASAIAENSEMIFQRFLLGRDPTYIGSEFGISFRNR